MICATCRLRTAGDRGKISFEYEGFLFNISKSGFQCEDCARQQAVEAFCTDGWKVVSLKDGVIHVDWDYYLQASTGLQERLTYILINIGILSWHAEGNWEVMALGPICLNPRTQSGGVVYFTREKDVMEFVQIDCSRCMYPWEVRHIDQVIHSWQINAH